jgi:hypothetical protein
MRRAFLVYVLSTGNWVYGGHFFWFSFKVLLPFGRGVCRQGSVTIRRGAWKGKVKGIRANQGRGTRRKAKRKRQKKQLRHNEKRSEVHRTQSLFAPKGQVVQKDGLLTSDFSSSSFLGIQTLMRPGSA